MSTTNDNRLQAFADVVTIDAWHKAFDGEVREVNLHADVVFGTARIGGEPESSVRFRLSVRRAELMVVIPNSEPLAVDPDSVSRDTPAVSGQMTETRVTSKSRRASAALAAVFRPKRPDVNAALMAAGEASVTSQKTLEVRTPIQFCLVTQSKSQDGHYRWIIESQAKNSLQGRPWEASAAPMRLTDTRRNRTKGIAPVVRLEVRCRREDLLIEDLEIKDEGLWASVKEKAGFMNRMAAAESYIRDQLTSLGLEVGNIEDKFGRLSLASVIAHSQSH